MGLQIDENQSKYQIFNLLNDLPFFDNFDDSEKREFISSENHILTVDSDSKIVTQGSIEFSLYFLLEGEVIVTKNEFPRLVVATLGPGAIFGEISILSQSPRTSNYIAKDEVKVLRLNGELFEKLTPPTQIKLNQQLIQVLIDQLESNSFSFLKLKAELDSIAQIGTQYGPTLVVYPDDVWYSPKTQGDIEEILQEHILNNRVVERIVIPFKNKS